jgi:hypothetical protein
MSVKLHRLSYEYAKNLISNRQCVLDERSDWTDHRPARTAEGRFIEQHGFAEYAKWHLGEDDEEPEGNSAGTSFPMETSIMFIAVRYSLPRRAPAKTCGYRAGGGTSAWDAGRTDGHAASRS